jgi:hypothetical protein
MVTSWTAASSPAVWLALIASNVVRAMVVDTAPVPGVARATPTDSIAAITAPASATERFI